MLFTSKDLRRLIFPLVIEQILAVTIGMADTLMVSSVGEAAVSGISLVDSINILLINIFAALATGGAVIASQYLGKRDIDGARFAGKQLIAITTFISLAIALVSIVLRDQIIVLAFGHVEIDVMRHCQTYFLISALSYPFLALYNSGAALFRSMGDSKISMYCSLAMNLINIVGNAILIFGFHMGVAGAALATLFSRVCGCVFTLWLLKKPQNRIYIDSYLHLGWNWQKIMMILGIGLPNGLENGMFQIGKIMVQSLIATFGTSGIAANAVAANITNIEIIPASAIGLGMITVVGHAIGAKEFEQAKQYTYRLMKIAMISTLLLNVLVVLSSDVLVGIYQMGPEASRLTKEIIFTYSIASALMWPLAFTLPNSLRAAGDARFTMTVSIVSMWLFRIALSYFFANALHMGVLGVWVAMYCDWVFRVILFIWRFVSGQWLRHVPVT